jgi:hypothetical protein
MSIGPGLKYDNAKLRVELLPVGALLEVAEVMTFGAQKYGADNWQNVTPRRRYYGAALRHLFARARGEVDDPESGFPHLAHAACCVLFMLSGEIGHDSPDAFEPAPVADPPRKFSVGDRVQPLGKFNPGKIERIDDTPIPYGVQLDAGAFVYFTGSELTKIEEPAPPEPLYAVGDRVRVVTERYGVSVGTLGTIERVDLDHPEVPYRVKLDSRETECWYRDGEVERV